MPSQWCGVGCSVSVRPQAVDERSAGQPRTTQESHSVPTHKPSRPPTRSMKPQAVCRSVSSRAGASVPAFERVKAAISAAEKLVLQQSSHSARRTRACRAW